MRCMRRLLSGCLVDVGVDVDLMCVSDFMLGGEYREVVRLLVVVFVCVGDF